MWDLGLKVLVSNMAYHDEALGLALSVVDIYSKSELWNLKLTFKHFII